jgi:hypothetical protein
MKITIEIPEGTELLVINALVPDGDDLKLTSTILRGIEDGDEITFCPDEVVQ